MILHDVCVIGAGPAGIAIALELAERGIKVALVESGGDSKTDEAQKLSDAEIITPNSHDDMRDAVQRGMGGTSALWGGRCVPLDKSDFEWRDFVEGSGWPFEASDLEPYYKNACQILGVGDAAFEVNKCQNLATYKRQLTSRFVETKTILATHLERWSCSPNVWIEHNKKISKHPLISVKKGLTCIGFRQVKKDDPVTEVLLKSTFIAESQPEIMQARFFVIACGGVESTRLVLNSIRDPLGLKLNTPELVGHYYMGHPSGKIADIELLGDPKETLYGFERDGEVYVRRRISFKPKVLSKEKLLNIVFWLDNPPLSDWYHCNGILSAAYLALTTPLLNNFIAPAAIRKRVVGPVVENRLRHIINCLLNPISSFCFTLDFFWKRYIAKPRLPGFFTYSASNRYALHYHAEQTPNWNSTIELSTEKDSLGLYRAKISLEWSDQDIDSILRAHKVLDQSLQDQGIGRLVYRYPVEKLNEAIHNQAVDGYHQIGTLRMTTDSTPGVTDSYGCLLGVPNVFVASSAVFPTSGQANPTLSLVALAVRQAEHIAKKCKSELCFE